MLPSGRIATYTYDASYGLNTNIWGFTFDETSGATLSATAEVAMNSDDLSLGPVAEVTGGFLVKTDVGLLWLQN